jgi:outer membrane protein assembly factor BamA
MHLPLLGDSLGGAIFYDAGNVFTNIRNITLRSSPPVPTIGTVTNAGVTTTVCLTNCTNELNYFSHTVGFEFRYSTPIGPVALDLGYQLNPAQFVFPTTVNGVAGLGLSRLPGFQFFINLGATF